MRASKGYPPKYYGEVTDPTPIEDRKCIFNQAHDNSLVCTQCGHNIADKHCKQCIQQLADEGTVITQFGVTLTGYAAASYSGPLYDPQFNKPKYSHQRPIVVQLLGQARAGKDFTASQLKQYYESIGLTVDLLSYAAPMKQIAATLFGITLEQLDDYKNQSDRFHINLIDYLSGDHGFDTNFRTLLQRLGNEAIKPIFGDAVWANLAQQTISKSTADIIIITDCRFSVELNTIGGTTVRVVNTALPAPMAHASELELADIICMYMLDNTNYQATQADIAELAERIINAS